MKIVFVLFLISTSLTMNAQNATTTKKTFKRTTTISTMVKAEPSVVWKLLTDGSNYTNWNSTIVSLEGNIVEGDKIKLISTLDPSRTFKLKVKEAVADQKLVWGDAMGERTYLLESTGNGTKFTMTEKIGGLMFPLFASKIPSFDESFETFAADLKKAAESK